MTFRNCIILLLGLFSTIKILGHVQGSVFYVDEAENLLGEI